MRDPILNYQNYPITKSLRSFMIKSDRWIRRMAQEHDMINPYSEKQVSDCRPETFRRALIRDRERRCRHRAAEFVCSGAVGRVLQDSAGCADYLRRQVNVRALRDHRERHAVRAGVGRLRYARNLKHHAAAGEDL